MNNLKVSIIIPTCNREVFYLKRAVESVLAQTHKNIEIIIVDDSHSKYKYRNNIAEYVNTIQLDGVVYLQNSENLGGSLSRNTGINIATGDYITFLDDDDKYLQEKIEKQLHFMVQGNYDLSFTNMVMYNEQEKIVDLREYRDIASFAKEDLLRYHLQKHLTGTPSFMFKRQKLLDIGGFEDKKMGQEFYLMLKSIESDLRIGYLDSCEVVVYKHNDGGITQGYNRIIGENTLYKFKKKYFHRLSYRERMFVRFRHFAVMFVAYKRINMKFQAVLAIAAAFIVSPYDFVIQVSGFINKIYHARKGDLHKNDII